MPIRSRHMQSRISSDEKGIKRYTYSTAISAMLPSLLGVALGSCKTVTPRSARLGIVLFAELGFVDYMGWFVYIGFANRWRLIHCELDGNSARVDQQQRVMCSG